MHSIHDHDMMSMHMDSSCSSSASMQAITGNNYQFDPFSLLDSRYDLTHADSLTNTTVPSCLLAQVGVGNGVSGDYINGIDHQEPEKIIMGLERDLYLPPLESRSIELEINNNNNNNGQIDQLIMKSNINHLNNSCFNNTDLSFKGDHHHHHHHQESNMFGFGNHGKGENLRIGEWDLEGLMQDISPFPFLDFQVE